MESDQKSHKKSLADIRSLLIQISMKNQRHQ